MKTDLYTKIVLTVIAVCLCIIAMKDIPFVSPAVAQNSTGPVSVNIVGVAGYKFSTVDVTSVEPYLPVKVYK
jgi:hypothetical protein